MAIKSKILFTFLLSTAVFVGGGAYLYTQYSQASAQYGMVDVSVAYGQPIVSSADLTGIQGKKSRSTSAASSDYSNMAPDLQSSSLSSIGSISATPATTTFSSVSSSGSLSATKESSLSASGGDAGPVLLAFSSGSRTSSSTSSSGLSAGGSVSSLSSSSTGGSPTILSVPLSTTDDVIVDPGGDPDPNSMIPVGEGWWLLILLSVVYFFIKRK